jgi:putative ABC transport system ATP-binding protein
MKLFIATRRKNIAAVLWVTHDRNEIAHADEVITLQPPAENAGGTA